MERYRRAVFSRRPLTWEEAEQLTSLRQTLLERERENPYYRSIEGAAVSLPEFSSGRYQRLAYWGTSGQRIASRYDLNAISRYEWLRYGRLLAGEDIRASFPLPSREDMAKAVRAHYEAIRAYAVRTDESLYSCGWLLDIARCLYTLRTGDVIAKTRGGEWALGEGLCPDEDAMRRALAVRRDPTRYKNDPETRRWLSSLGPQVQAFADVLEKELAPFTV